VPEPDDPELVAEIEHLHSDAESWVETLLEEEFTRPRGAVTQHVVAQLRDIATWTSGMFTYPYKVFTHEVLAQVRALWPMSDGCLDGLSAQLATMVALDEMISAMCVAGRAALKADSSDEMLHSWMPTQIANQESTIQQRTTERSLVEDQIAQLQRASAPVKSSPRHRSPWLGPALLVVALACSYPVLATDDDGLGWQLLAVALGAFVLHVFFRVVQSEWPQNYFEFETPTDPIVSRDPLRYGLFRLAPIYLICLFASVSLERSGYASWWVVLAIALLHVGSTTARGLAEIARGAVPPRARPGRLVYHASVIVGAALVALASLFGHATLSPLIPDLQVLSQAAWTAVIAGLAGAYLVTRVRPSGENVGPLIRRSNRELASDLITHAKQAAARESIDWQLFFSLMTVENLQRPEWVRRIERVAGRLIGSTGSYGLMQVQAANPISDRESIDRAASILSGTKIPIQPPTWLGGTPMPDFTAVRRTVHAYNPDEQYVGFVEKVYYYLHEHPMLLP
jgi:hypothetical protein